MKNQNLYERKYICNCCSETKLCSWRTTIGVFWTTIVFSFVFLNKHQISHLDAILILDWDQNDRIRVEYISSFLCLLHSQMHKEFVECESMQTYTFVPMFFLLCHLWQLMFFVPNGWILFHGNILIRWGD